MAVREPVSSDTQLANFTTTSSTPLLYLKSPSTIWSSSRLGPTDARYEQHYEQSASILRSFFT
jgi:hypothetical protein